MKKDIIFYCILLLLFAACKASKPAEQEQTEPSMGERLSRENREMEEKEPARFLSIDSTSIAQHKVKDPGIFTAAKYEGWNIQGSLTNQAVQTAYNKVALNIHFLDENEKELETKEQVIEGYFNPGDSKTFQFTIDAHREATNYRVSVKTANPLKTGK